MMFFPPWESPITTFPSRYMYKLLYFCFINLSFYITDWRLYYYFVMRVSRKYSPVIRFGIAEVFFWLYSTRANVKLLGVLGYSNTLERVNPLCNNTVLNRRRFCEAFILFLSYMYYHRLRTPNCTRSNSSITRCVLNILVILRERAELPSQTYTHKYERVLSTKPYYSNKIIAIKIKYTGFYRCRQ